MSCRLQPILIDNTCIFNIAGFLKGKIVRYKNDRQLFQMFVISGDILKVIPVQAMNADLFSTNSKKS